MVPGWVKSDRKPDPEGSIPSVSNTLAQNSNTHKIEKWKEIVPCHGDNSPPLTASSICKIAVYQGHLLTVSCPVILEPCLNSRHSLCSLGIRHELSILLFCDKP